MSTTRRSFIKVASGGLFVSALGFDVTPRLRAGQDAQDRAHHRDAQHLSVLLGQLRRHHPHARRQGEERHCRRWSTSKAIPTIRSIAARSVPKGASLEQDILNERRLLKPQVRRPGSDHWEDISWDQAIDEIARQVKKTRDETFVEKDTERPHRQPLRRHRLDRRLHRHQRIQLSRRQDDAQPGGLLPGKPGPGLTRSHGLQFGAHIRTRRDDQRLDRHQEHRHDVDHGWQSGREPPVRLQVADRSQAAAQRQDDRRRSALHAHGGDRRSLPADPRRHRHRVPRRPDQLRDRTTTASRTTTSSTTPTPRSSSRKASSCLRTGCISGFDRATQRLRQVDLELRSRRQRRPAQAAAGGAATATAGDRGTRAGQLRTASAAGRQLAP